MTEDFQFDPARGAAPNAAPDERVALIKSLATNNRFYVLVSGASEIRNADTVEEIPHESLLGIAYPCLEDGLNDFAVIRTAFETVELFHGDEEMHHELMEIIHDARRNLIRRLMELLERLIALKAYFLGTDLEKFKENSLELMRRGFPRKDLDRMMKVNIFASVEAANQTVPGASASRSPGLYRYEFHNSDSLERLSQLPPREFLISLFSDVLDSVLEDDNYGGKDAFDCHVFQQFIALMFVSYASTDPVFYGTHPDDYGVSKGKSMDETPLYQAIKRELHRISALTPAGASQREWKTRAQPGGAAPNDEPKGHESKGHESKGHEEVADFLDFDFDFDFDFEMPRSGEVAQESRVQLSNQLANEDALLRPIASISALALQLQKHYRGDTAELSQLILAEASRLVQELKRLGILSPLADDPSTHRAPPDAL